MPNDGEDADNSGDNDNPEPRNQAVIGHPISANSRCSRQPWYQSTDDRAAGSRVARGLYSWNPPSR